MFKVINVLVEPNSFYMNFTSKVFGDKKNNNWISRHPIFISSVKNKESLEGYHHCVKLCIDTLTEFNWIYSSNVINTMRKNISDLDPIEKVEFKKDFISDIISFTFTMKNGIVHEIMFEFTTVRDDKTTIHIHPINVVCYNYYDDECNEFVLIEK